MIRVFVALIAASLLAVADSSMAAPPPLEAYGKLPAMEMVTLSPSGERYAFIADDGQGRKLYVATTDNKGLLILPVGKNKIRSLDWAGDDYIVIYKKATVDVGPDYTVEKQDLASAIVINITTKKAILVFHGRHSVAQTIYGYYGSAQINGKWYGYFGGNSLEQAPGVDNWRYSNTYVDGSIEHINTDLYRVDLGSKPNHGLDRFVQIMIPIG
jgi:hypothetical protein